MINWSRNQKHMFINLTYFLEKSRRTKELGILQLRQYQNKEDDL